MADWSAGDDEVDIYGQNNLSIHNSENHYLCSHSSSASGRMKKDLTLPNSHTDDNGIKHGKSEVLELNGGDRLNEESPTENNYNKNESLSTYSMPTIPSRKPINGVSNDRLKSPSINLSPLDMTEEEKVTITMPADGNLYSFTPEQMGAFFRHMRVPERIINYMLKKRISGKKFSILKDSELDHLGINDPITCYFRERSKRKKHEFVL